MIMISGQKDTASAPAQKELAEEVLGKLASGAEFEQVAQMYSEDSTKENGGDWGWIERKTLAEPLEKFAFNMPVGRISNIIDYAGNYYILKVEDKHGGSTKHLVIAAANDRGVLYGAFALLRKIGLGEPIADLDEKQTPSAP